MKRVCAWCRTPLGEKEGGDGQTDGLCPKCQKEQDALIAQMPIEESDDNWLEKLLKGDKK